MTRTGHAHAAVVVAAVLAAGVISGQTREPDGGASARREGTQEAGAGARMFVTDMAMAGMAEVELGKVAADRALDADVKAFGQLMVTDHSRSNDELKQAASQVGVEFPKQLDPKRRSLVDRLSGLGGADFDSEYMSAMVEAHQDVVAKVSARASGHTSGQDAAAGHPADHGATGATAPGGKPSPAAPDATLTRGGSGEQAITRWATAALPRVQGHLERARELQRKVTK